jgi:voltage-gated potassium channel
MRRLDRSFESGRILPYLVATVTSVAFGFGFIMWLVDREDFPTLGTALWWAVSTVTTVGYGDVVPTSPLGRGVAAVLMVFGFASLSLLTGIVASLLVQERTSHIHQKELVEIGQRLAEVERLLRESKQGT